MPRIIIAYKPGQLSNRLLQFAAFIAFARRTGVQVVNPSLDEYACLLESTHRSLVPCYPPAAVQLPATRWARRFVYSLSYLAARALVRSGVGGRRFRVIWLDWVDRRVLDDAFERDIADAWLVFVQGWRFVLPHGPEDDCVGPPGDLGAEVELVRDYLKPRAMFRRRAAGIVADARRNCDRLIGVHIRQGDFLTDKNRGRYFYTTEAYARKMHEARQAWRDERVGFVVCSNVPQAHQPFTGLTCTFARDEPVVEQLVLAGCDAILGPPSSFSLWAAFVGGSQLCWIFDVQEAITRDSFRPYAPVDQDEFAEKHYDYANAKTGGVP